MSIDTYYDLKIEWKDERKILTFHDAKVANRVFQELNEEFADYVHTEKIIGDPKEEIVQLVKYPVYGKGTRRVAASIVPEILFKKEIFKQLVESLEQKFNT